MSRLCPWAEVRPLPACKVLEQVRAEFARSGCGQAGFHAGPGRTGVRKAFLGGALPAASPSLLLGVRPPWLQLARSGAARLRILSGYGHSQAHFSPRIALHCPTEISGGWSTKVKQ